MNTVHDSVIAEIEDGYGPHFRDLAVYCFTMDCYRFLEELYGIDFNVPLGAGVTIGERWQSPDSVEIEMSVRQDGTYWIKGKAE